MAFNVTKIKTFESSFFYEGNKVELTLKRGYTSKEIDQQTTEIEAEYGEKSLEGLSALMPLQVESWNLEDNDGDIPVGAADIYARVPLPLLVAISMHIQEVTSNGGLTKKR